MTEPCPECRAGKHGNCDSTTWDFDKDEGAVCPCWLANGGNLNNMGGPCRGPQ